MRDRALPARVCADAAGADPAAGLKWKRVRGEDARARALLRRQCDRALISRPEERSDRALPAAAGVPSAAGTGSTSRFLIQSQREAVHAPKFRNAVATGARQMREFAAVSELSRSRSDVRTQIAKDLAATAWIDMEKRA